MVSARRRKWRRVFSIDIPLVCYRLLDVVVAVSHPQGNADLFERDQGTPQHVTNNRSYETFAQFRSAILRFLRRTVPKKWDRFRDRITDNFRIISPDDFRVVA
jgi:hypothetical protein